MFQHARRFGGASLPLGSEEHIRHRARLLVALGILLAVATAQLLLPSVTRSATSVTYKAVADTYVSESNANGKHGARKIIKVDGGGEVRSGYVRFDVAPSDTPIRSATLRLYSKADAKLGVAIRLLSNAWSEQSTYDDGPTPGILVGHSAPLEGGEWTEIDVTSAVARVAALRAGGAVSLSVTNSPFFVAGDGWAHLDKKQRRFATRESDKAPELVIETGDTTGASVPRPTMPPTTAPRPPVPPTVAPPTPTPTPTPTPRPSPGATQGVWINASELAALPTSGAAWQSLLSQAEGALGTANLADQDSNHDTATLATALAAARTGRADLRAKAESALVSAIDTENGARWLAVGRNLGAYAIAADVLGLRADGNPSSAGSRVQAWLARFLTRTLAHNNNGGPITFHDSAWNSGSNASAQEGFAHAAVAAYVGNQRELDWAWNGFRRYAGDRSSPHSLSANDTSWQARADDPVGIQDAGASKNGCRLDGAIGNDMSRGGAFSCSPGLTQYPWVGLAGAVPAAVVLERAGYPSWNVANQAMKRALDYLWQVRSATGNAAWFDGDRGAQVVYVVNRVYGTNFPVRLPTGEGQTVGWTDWTHSR